MSKTKLNDLSSILIRNGTTERLFLIYFFVIGARLIYHCCYMQNVLMKAILYMPTDIHKYSYNILSEVIRL